MMQILTTTKTLVVFGLLAALAQMAMAQPRLAKGYEYKSTSSRANDNEQIYMKVARATARVINGKTTGTAWVVDAEDRLLITNFHVAAVQTGGSDWFDSVARRVKLVFPIIKDGHVKQDAFWYRDQSQISAEVVWTSKRQDLVLLKADRLPHGTNELELSIRPPKPGSSVHSVGHPAGSNALWVYSKGTVRAVSTYEGDSKHGSFKFDAIETQSPINPGDSGGAMVNDDGKVVGVVQGAAVAIPNKGRWVDLNLMSFSIAAMEVYKVVGSYRSVETGETHSDYYNRGITFYRRQEYTAAIREFDKAIDADSGHVEYWLTRAKAKKHLRQYDSAIQDVRQSMEVSRRSNSSEVSTDGTASQAFQAILDKLRNSIAGTECHSTLGGIYLSRGIARKSSADWRRAVDAYDTVINSGEPEARDYYNRGLSKHWLKRYSDALADYRRTIEVDGGKSSISLDAADLIRQIKGR